MTVAVYDEESYAAALSEYLNRSKETEFVCHVFTDMQKLQEYLQHNRGVYLLINETRSHDIDFIEVEEKNKILLCENRSGERCGAWIYKYQSARTISKELISHIYQNEDERGREAEKFYVVFSPMGSIDRKEYSLTLLKDLSEKGSTLFIDMDPFPMEKEREGGMEKGISELIYYLKRGGTDIKWKIKALIQTDGSHGRIYPSRCSMDLNEIIPGDIKTLINVLKEMTEYDFVVINLGVYTEASLELFRHCHNIEVVVTRNETGKEMAEVFIEQMKLLKIKDVERKVQIVEFEARLNM